MESLYETKSCAIITRIYETSGLICIVQRNLGQGKLQITAILRRGFLRCFFPHEVFHSPVKKNFMLPIVFLI